MNMILHGDGHSGIQQINSLEHPDYISPITKEYLKFDIIVTNMPFSQGITKKMIQNNKTVTENHIAPLYYNGISKNNGDAACVLHCLQSLKEGGRMELVVPEGFLFRRDTSTVRQFLLSKAQLQAVISLPQGTFLPYTGVKTSILYFTDAHKPNNQKEYWFYEVKNIGVTLDNKKRKIKGINDLDKIYSSDLNKISKNPRLKANMLELGFEIIDLEKVKNNNYNLVGSSYRKIIKNKDIKSFFDLLEDGVITGKKGNMITKNTANNGNIPVIAAGQTSPYSHNQYNFSGNIITISSSGAYAGYIWYHNSPIWASDCSVVYSTNEKLLLTKYLYYILKSQQNIIYQKQSGSGQPHVYLKDLGNLQIPLHSFEEQQKIVEELNSYQQIIDGAKQIIDSWKPNISVKKEWKLIKLNDICKNIVAGGDYPENYSNIPTKDHNIPIYANGTDENALYGYGDKARITEDSLTISARGTIGHISIRKAPFFPIVRLIAVTPNLEKVNLKFLKLALNQSLIISTGSATQQLTVPMAKDIIVALPPLAEQKIIIEQIEKEEAIIEQNKELIKIMKTRIEARLQNLYEK